MKRSALPLVCWRYVLVHVCLMPRAWQVSANYFDRYAEPLSVISRLILTPKASLVRHCRQEAVHGCISTLVCAHLHEAHA